MATSSTHFLQFCIQWASIALLYYDFLLTFPMECKYIWGARFRLSTALYICCRYALVANVVYLLTISGRLEQGVSGALSVLGRAAIIIVWSGRTYAVFAKSRVVMVYFILLGLACVVLDIIHPLLRSFSDSDPHSVGGLLSILMCIFEFSSAGLTALRSVQAIQATGPWHAQKSSFLYLILEQGVIYFSAVSVFTLASLILDVKIPVSPHSWRIHSAPSQRAHPPPLRPPHGRFLLHLRKWEAAQDPVASAHAPTETIGMQFRRTRTVGSVVAEFGEDPVRRARSEQGQGGGGERHAAGA
ncbi:hypothetical protein BD779DRAFT_1676556 [Infundibulicybe gibba]|nr:hypothetical protein BD779DRAFT_1676556 [Infundibulicybe gibba]